MERPDLQDNPVAKHALWLIERSTWLKRHGLVECEACKNWIYDRPNSIRFHYRRCEG